VLSLPLPRKVLSLLLPRLREGIIEDMDANIVVIMDANIVIIMDANIIIIMATNIVLVTATNIVLITVTIMVKLFLRTIASHVSTPISIWHALKVNMCMSHPRCMVVLEMVCVVKVEIPIVDNWYMPKLVVLAMVNRLVQYMPAMVNLVILVLEPSSIWKFIISAEEALVIIVLIMVIILIVLVMVIIIAIVWVVALVVGVVGVGGGVTTVVIIVVIIVIITIIAVTIIIAVITIIAITTEEEDIEAVEEAVVEVEVEDERSKRKEGKVSFLWFILSKSILA